MSNGHTMSHSIFIHDFAPKISMEKSADLASIPGLIYGRNVEEPRTPAKYESNCVGGTRNSIGITLPLCYLADSFAIPYMHHIPTHLAVFILTRHIILTLSEVPVVLRVDDAPSACLHSWNAYCLCCVLDEWPTSRTTSSSRAQKAPIYWKPSSNAHHTRMGGICEEHSP